jgi:outer membrane immunogenic protein
MRLANMTVTALTAAIFCYAAATATLTSASAATETEKDARVAALQKENAKLHREIEALKGKEKKIVKLRQENVALKAKDDPKAAYAAYMPTKAPVLTQSPATWTGCYVNGGFGYGTFQDNHYGEFTGSTDPITDTTTSGGKGWLGNVGAGCDYQFTAFGNWNVVAGAFGDYDFGDVKGTFEGSVPIFTFAPPLGVAAVDGMGRQRYAWAVGGRIGLLVTPTLLTYVNGGYTETRFDQIDLNYSGGGGPLGSSLAATTFHGWFLGGGTEFAVTSIPGVFWRNEYRYSSFRAADRLGIDTATGASVFISEHSKIDTQSMLTELVYRFSWTMR